MSNMLMTVEQAAEELKLHPKTVLRYIRENRLQATRIGKAYRIDRSKLDAFAGMASGRAQPPREVRATVIVEVPAFDAEAAERMATFLGAAALGGGAETRPLHFNTAFDPTSGNLKIVLIAAASDAARLLELIELQLGLSR
ncbi:MAG: helix-turn-helix domain-containing protein [Bosea sp.]|uniref:helix-turn-helix domain-containing protein n=1 Tax=Bosea sp. (in: a-proteobacteria) TaxID=1871050 RepID=UPI001AC6BCCA|nr:helix-turn-helix domain-containing protein [Bosea sp. (in: a-proteobacteria)]MBN9451269.1 helix-turn-helix domain-containing protein [Bosea sp. (in: a-proteobacteria)]